ncbi:MAG: TonB-dependent receptor [Phormidesmis sp.]
MASTTQINQILRVGFTGVVLGVGLLSMGTAQVQAASSESPIVFPMEAYQAGPKEEQLPSDAKNKAFEPKTPQSYVAVAPTWLPETNFLSEGEATGISQVAIAPLHQANLSEDLEDWQAIALTPPEAKKETVSDKLLSVTPTLTAGLKENSEETPVIRERALPDPASLTWSINPSELISGDSSTRVAIAPTWFADSEKDAEAPDWIERLNVGTTISLAEFPGDFRDPSFERWIATAPGWLLEPAADSEKLNLNSLALESRTLIRNVPVPRLAVSASGLANSSEVAYDARSIPQIAITPADLANAGEVAIAVSASQVEILTPRSGEVLDIPSTPIALQFPVGAKIALLVNGRFIDSSQVGRTETDPTTQLRIQTWYGISLEAGDNLIEVVSSETGEVFASRPVIVRGQPEDITLFAPETIPADGRSTAVIRGQLVDDVGIASVWNTTVTLSASDGEFIGADQNPDQPGFQAPVVNGEFSAELQSSLTAHLVQLQVKTAGFEAFRQIQFTTPQRPSLVSGVVDIRLGARGTDFYDSYRDFLPLDGDNSYELDVDTAVFATGNLGEWLYTGAYNSDRTLNENCRGESTLFRTSDSDCGNSYPTYGDDSSSDIVAPSLDSVYLRLERNSPTNITGIDYAMWGDYSTEEFATASQLFTATNRQLHGFKANYNFGNLAVTGLYANNVEGFQRDTIAPDGTSGFYFTSQRNLVPGSESVYLELEELERPGTVLDRKPLTRNADYEIDYDRGTLLFRDPITRTEVDDFGQLLVRRIVTTYQHEDGGNTDILAGRVQYNIDRPQGQQQGQQQGQESWVGASYFTENQGNRDFELYGVDAQITLGENARVIAEIAESSNSFETAGDVSGTAYRIEADGKLGNWLNGRTYFRSTDAGFTNSATTSFVPGQTRYGAQLTGQLGRNTSLRAQFDHEDNFGTAPQVITDVSPLLAGLNNEPGAALDNSLTTYSLGLSQRIGKGTAEVDWIHRDRTDRIDNDTNLSSDQIRTRLTTPIANKLSLVAQNELNLSSNVDPIYPSRTLIGLNWEAAPWLNVGVNQIFYGGGGNNRGSVTSVDVTGEHTFASDTTLRGRVSSVDGRQIGGTIGLEQGINLAPGLNLDLGYEKVFSTFGNATAAGTQFSQPFANSASALGLSGGESYSVGLSYTDNPDFQASTRFEHRSSTRSSNTVFNLSALGRITPSLTVLGDYRLANAANQRITGLGTTSLLKLGMAYRNPEDDRFNALLRYEHRMNPNTIPTTANLGASTETQEHLFAAEAIYAPNWRWELYGKYALRNSRTAINGTSGDFSSSSTVQLAQARATYRLGYRWDVVGEARWLGGRGYSETGFSVEAGYYPLPDLRLSAGYSMGAADRDFGENRNAGGFYIGATAKLSGLLNGFGTQPSAPPQQQESAIGASQASAVPTEDAANADFTESEPVSSAPETYPTTTEL